jgi:hypothetical protein
VDTSESTSAAESACRKPDLAYTGSLQFSVGYDGPATPVSSSTRNESALLVGSMIRANTNWRNTSSVPAA